MRLEALGWCITGAGAFLEESLEVASVLSQDMKVSFFVSKAGEEVLEMYGYMDRLYDIVSGGYLDEVLLASDSGYSFPKTGRFMTGRYDALVVSPATSNTVGKMANGISDTIVTNCFSHATKTGVYTVVVPVEHDSSSSLTPYYISRDRCVRCSECDALEVCPSSAIRGYEIDYNRCIGCGRCVEVCPEDAVLRYEVDVLERRVDRENIDRVSDMDGVCVLGSPNEIIGLFG
ncbi:flavoprotein [Methanonatronarchaeum sp. AMET-Sl]|uniref:flavoprotein n=1 Tax=Methanonatronarchaeum sp. AMET-Sl TaxID=3037654 RepID=UPI00244DD73F|nr:flavoprotein [Methanonatronarchaeum sp. AMET-Sl]WGI16663.1 flavoprotein [Methanonatronarchaeum sp. AMET-Sl]